MAIRDKTRESYQRAIEGLAVGKSVAEIAAEENITRDGMYTRLHRARVVMGIKRKYKSKPRDRDFCTHGLRLGQACLRCDDLWFREVTLPDLRRRAARIVRFYDNNPTARDGMSDILRLLRALAK